MRGVPAGRLAFAIIAVLAFSSDPTLAEDGIAVQSMRIEGTIAKPDHPAIAPFRQNPPPVAVIGDGERNDFCVIVKQGEAYAVVFISFGGDKELKEQVAKLAGQRVVVECKGRYELNVSQQKYELNWVPYEVKVARPVLILTATKIRPAE